MNNNDNTVNHIPEKSPNTWLVDTIYTNINTLKKNNHKIPNELFTIPEFCDYNNIIKYNYNVQQLKKTCKHYKIKQSGNKNEVMIRVYNHLKLSFYITKIQATYRGYLQRRLDRLKGLSLFKRKISTNDEDFISFDPINKIHPNNYFSYNNGNHNYGFDIVAIYNLIIKSNIPANPYNREQLSNKTIYHVKEVIRLSKILKKNLVLTINNEILNNDKLKIIELFHIIDSFGNLSHFNWFYSLHKMQLIRLYRELYDIWHYRAQLTNERKQHICYPTGNPFIRTDSLFLINFSIEEIHSLFIRIFNNLLTKAVDNNYQSLGAYYILGALTIVNNDAAMALPWLYESFSIITNV